MDARVVTLNLVIEAEALALQIQHYIQQEGMLIFVSL